MGMKKMGPVKKKYEQTYQATWGCGRERYVEETAFM